MAKTFVQSPDAVLDYQFDWRAKTHGVAGAASDWLEAEETISSYTVTVEPPGMTVDSSIESDGAVTAWLSGGAVEHPYTITCQIVTSASRTDSRVMVIRIQER